MYKQKYIIDARLVTIFSQQFCIILFGDTIISMVSLYAWPPSARRAINLSLRHKILCNTLQCRHEHHCIGFSPHLSLCLSVHDKLKDWVVTLYNWDRCE